MCLFKRKKNYEDDQEVLAYVQRLVDVYLSFEYHKTEYFRGKVMVIPETVITFNWRLNGDILEVRDTHVRTTLDKEDLIDVLINETENLNGMRNKRMYQ